MPEMMIELLPLDFRLDCQIKCFEHANAIANILFALRNLHVDFPFMDSGISVCTYQCARILLYAYRTNADRFSLTYNTVAEKIELCLSVLKNLPGRSLSRESIVSQFLSESLFHSPHVYTAKGHR